MSSAILTFPGGQAVAQPRTSRYEQGQRHYWRKRENDFHNDQRRAKCTRCKGTGELTVSDGTGCIDFDLCPTCQRSYVGGDAEMEPF